MYGSGGGGAAACLGRATIATTASSSVAATITAGFAARIALCDSPTSSTRAYGACGVPRSVVVVFRSLLLVAACAGCQRGCLSTWLTDHGRGAPSSTGSSPLEGTDCSDGLVRCVDGHVEASVLAHVPFPCASGPEGSKACVCPWAVLGECRAGCAEDGLELLVRSDTDAGALADALCRPLAPVARAVLDGDGVTPGVCPARSLRCTDGVVRSCEAAGAPERAVAWCLHGCEARLSIDLDETGGSTNLDGRVPILCRRPDAERR